MLKAIVRGINYTYNNPDDTSELTGVNINFDAMASDGTISLSGSVELSPTELGSYTIAEMGAAVQNKIIKYFSTEETAPAE